MIVCPNCGTENPDGAQFCRKDGFYLGYTSPTGEPPGSGVSATLKIQDLQIEAGGQMAAEVEVHNDGRRVDEYRLNVSGPDPAWCSVEPKSLRLMPKTPGSARILFRPPRSSNPPAGTIPFVVTARSTVDPTVRASVAGSVTIAPFAEIAASLVPQTSESTEVAEHTVRVENRGNGPNRIALTVEDPDDKLSNKVTPPDLALAPGSAGSARVGVWARNHSEPRGGRRLPFQVRVQPVAGVAVRLDGATILLERQPSKPQPKWPWALAAALALIVVVIVILLHPGGGSGGGSAGSDGGTVPAKLTLSSQSLTFGKLTIGRQSDPLTLTVTNTGGSKTNVTAQLSDTKNFKTVRDLCAGSQMAPNQQCQLQIAFTPHAVGDLKATVAFTSDSGATPDPVVLGGTGLLAHGNILEKTIGRCIDDANSVTDNGNPIVIYRCTTNPNQDWTVGLDGTLHVLGKCMDISNASTSDGALIALYECHNGANQFWQLRSDGSLLNPVSGKCLEDPSSGVELTQLILATCSGGSNQQWVLPA